MFLNRHYLRLAKQALDIRHQWLFLPLNDLKQPRKINQIHIPKCCPLKEYQVFQYLKVRKHKHRSLTKHPLFCPHILCSWFYFLNLCLSKVQNILSLCMLVFHSSLLSLQSLQYYMKQELDFRFRQRKL